jgi:hypothetical protein
MYKKYTSGTTYWNMHPRKHIKNKYVKLDKKSIALLLRNENHAKQQFLAKAYH